MSWLLRAVRLPTAAAAMVLAAVLMLLLRGRAQPLPSLVAGHLVPIPLAATAGLPVLVALLHCSQTLPVALTRTCVRPVAVVVPALAMLLPLGAAASTAVLVGTAAAAELGRDSAGLCGLLLIGFAVTRSTSAVGLPLAFLMLVFLGGTDAAGEPFAWAWLLLPERDLTSWLAATVALIVGLTACALRRSWWVDER